MIKTMVECDGYSKEEAFEKTKKYLESKNYKVISVNLRGLEGIAIGKDVKAIRIFEKKRILNSNRSINAHNWVWPSSKKKEKMKLSEFDDVEFGFWIQK